MITSRRTFITAALATTAGAFVARRPADAAGRALTPEMFGAKGDGRTNDTKAFQALAAQINKDGGGEIVFRRTTYIVGMQTRGTPSKRLFWAFRGAPLLEIRGCTQPLTIRGNGAVIRCEAGLRYGTFDPVTGERTVNKMPYVKKGQLATPYHYMIRIRNCSGPIRISDLELDGNIGKLLIGGPYGDTGRQIPAVGIKLFNNRGGERISNVYTHHHGQDGLVIDGLDEATGAERRVSRLRSEYNGRQGCSLVGGRGYAFDNCTFSHTGRGGVRTAPGSGFDIEAERGKKVRDISFTNCEFSNNSGAGMVADSGDSENITFAGCTFIGTTTWAAWPDKPRMRFRSCKFVGAIVKCFGDPDPERATQFRECTFRDDPKLSPTGEVFLTRKAVRPAIADLNRDRNVLFDRCAFLLSHRGVLPWSAGSIYLNCRLEQKSRGRTYPRGRYRGRNTIKGNVGLNGSFNEGELIVNGVPRPRGRIG